MVLMARRNAFANAACSAQTEASDVAQTNLPQLNRTETTLYGEARFSSRAVYEPDIAVTIANQITNATTKDGHFEWHDVATIVVGQGQEWLTTTTIRLGGPLGHLRLPSQTQSDVTLTTTGGLVAIHDVPRWVPLMYRIQRIPRALAGGVVIVVKHFISGASPGVIVTGEVTAIERAELIRPAASPFDARQPTLHYRFTAVAEGDAQYTLGWNGMSSVVITHEVPVVLEEFTHSGAVELMEASVELSHGNWTARATVPVFRPIDSEQLEYEDAVGGSESRPTADA
jgi:hypothetical protein